MLSVAEVFEMQAGDEQNATWINPGFTAVVENVKSTKTQKGQTMNICTLQDQTGSARISMTVFGPVKFSEGNVIEVSGQGLRRTEYKGLAQVSLGKATEVHVIGASVHHQDQAARKENLEPAVNGSKQHINGQTVGMAVKEALTLVRDKNDPGLTDINKPEFWAQVHQTASAIIRLSNSLEHGNLTPPLSQPKAAAPAQPPQRKPLTDREQQAVPNDGQPEDSIPF